MKLYFHPSFSLISLASTCVPFANRYIVIFSGLVLSLFPSSFHVFVPLISIVSGGVYVFIMSYPFTCFVYFSTSLSSTVYFISCLLSSYFASPVKLYFHPSFSLISLASTCVPFANRYIVIFSGLVLSLFPSSFHVFVPLISIVSGGVYVFIMSYPFTCFVYFSTSLSSTVYFISCLLSSYFASPVKLYFHPSFSLISLASTCFPFANKYIVIFSGLVLSLFPSSFHVFVPLISIVSGGVYVFIMSYPFTCFVYFSTSLSSTVYFISCLLSSYFASPVKLYFHPSFSLISLASTCVPFANRYIVIFSGLVLSLFPSSFHVFVPLISIVSGGVYVFIMSYPFTCFVYFSTSLSSTVYFISCLLSSYFASPVKLYFHPSFSLISLASTCFPFANKYIVIFSGLVLSLFPSSFHVFVPFISTV